MHTELPSSVPNQTRTTVRRGIRSEREANNLAKSLDKTSKGRHEVLPVGHTFDIVRVL